jgi:ketosteroid isomerase-like protein
MKAAIFIVAILLCILGCNQKQIEELTQQQNDQIKKEVKAVMDSSIAKINRQDMNGFLEYYSPELVCIYDSSIFNFETYKKICLDFPNEMSSWKWITVRFDCIVLTNDFVVSTWIGKCEFYGKLGEKTTVNPRDYTNVFKRVNGIWKVIYEHSSSGTAVTEKAEKE